MSSGVLIALAFTATFVGGVAVGVGAVLLYDRRR